MAALSVNTRSSIQNQSSYLVELDDIGVSYFLQNVDLTSNSLYIALVLDAIFFQNFNSDLFSSNRVSPNAHLSKCT